MKQFTVILGTCLFLACQRETVTFVLSPQEEKLIGKWQEIANKLPIRDSSGMVIDSLDISAQYEFKADYTFTSQNEFFTNAESEPGYFNIPTPIQTYLFIRIMEHSQMIHSDCSGN